MIMHNAARTRLIERLKGAERIMQVLEGQFQTERREKKTGKKHVLIIGVEQWCLLSWSLEKLGHGTREVCSRITVYAGFWITFQKFFFVLLEIGRHWYILSTAILWFDFSCKGLTPDAIKAVQGWVTNCCDRLPGKKDKEWRVYFDS